MRETHPAASPVVVYIHETARVAHSPLLRVDKHPREPSSKPDIVAATAPAVGERTRDEEDLGEEDLREGGQGGEARK